MNIQLACVGKLKEQYWTKAVEEYSKRLGNYCTLTVSEIKEERVSDNPSKAEEAIVVDEEGKRLLKTIKAGAYIIALDIKGKQLSSEELSEKMEALRLQGKSDATFLIGGSLGLSEEILKQADLRLSFSDMTFPHQMMRVILLEQIYRSYKIARNELHHSSFK